MKVISNSSSGYSKGVDTSSSGAGNVTRAIKNLRIDLDSYRKAEVNARKSNMTRSADSPYFNDRPSSEKIRHKSASEGDWRKTGSRQQDLVQVQANYQLKKLNII